VHKSASDSNVRRSLHRRAIFIAFNAWSHEHCFVVEGARFPGSSRIASHASGIVHRRVLKLLTKMPQLHKSVGHRGRKTWQRPKDRSQPPKVADAVTFINSAEVIDMPAQGAAQFQGGLVNILSSAQSGLRNEQQPREESLGYGNFI